MAVYMPACYGCSKQFFGQSSASSFAHRGPDSGLSHKIDTTAAVLH